MEREEIVTLPSGTELDLASALGDLGRARERLEAEAERIEQERPFIVSPETIDAKHQEQQDLFGLISDLGHVAEYVELLGQRDRVAQIREAAFKLAAADVHLGRRAAWRSNGDVVADVAEIDALRPLTLVEAAIAVQAYDEICAIHECERR